MSKGFRVTVRDLETDEEETMELHAGDFMLIPVAPCVLEYSTGYPTGTVQLTLKGHRPGAKAKVMSP